MGVTSFEETPDVSCLAVTPAGSKGALGTWRSQGGSRTLRRDQAALEAGTRSWVNQRVRGVRMSVLEPRRDLGKTCEGKPRSEPDWGNPTVRDRRGACGIVVTTGSRTEAHRETAGIATGPYGCVRAALLSRPPFARLVAGGAFGFRCDLAGRSVNSRPCKTPQTCMNTGFAGHAPMFDSPEFNSNRG